MIFLRNYKRVLWWALAVLTVGAVAVLRVGATAASVTALGPGGTAASGPAMSPEIRAALAPGISPEGGAAAVFAMGPKITRASASTTSVSEAATEPKITSLNQCYDELPFQGQVQATYDHGGRLESILQFAPDVVFANRFNSPLLIARLRERDLHVVILPEPQSLAEVALLFEELSAYLPDSYHGMTKGNELGPMPKFGVGAAAAYVAAWPQIWKGKRVLMLQANHYSFGADTLWDEVVTALGGINVAPGVGLVTVLPERVLTLDPDVIVVIEGEDFALASRNSLHGALATLVDSRGVSISSALNGCMAQQLGSLVEALAQ